MVKKINFILFAITLVGLTISATVIFQMKISDTDLWLHLKTGEYICHNKAIPKEDIFSFTKEHKPWIDHEWLLQATCHFIYKNFSFDGLLFLKSLIFMSAFFILLIGVYDKFMGLPALALLFLFIGTTLNRITLRPGLFSLFFIIIFLAILYKKRDNPLFLFILPVLQVFWVNIHGYFFLGHLVLAIFWIEEIISKKSLRRSILSPIGAVFFLSVIATFANPYFLKGALYPFFIFWDIITGKSKELFGFIMELKSPFKSEFVSARFYKAAIVISFLSFFFLLKDYRGSCGDKNIKPGPSNRKFRLFSADKRAFLRRFITRARLNLFLWTAILIFSMGGIRNVHFFGAVSVFITLDNLKGFLQKLHQRARPLRLLLLNFSLVVVVCFFSWKIAQPRLFNISYILKEGILKPRTYIGTKEEVVFPYEEAAFLKKFEPTKRFFNDFNSGAFLTFNAPSGYKVFIDGRTEFYGKDFLKDYKKTCEGDQDIFDKLVNKYNLQGFFISYRGLDFTKKLLGLLYRKKWKVVFFGDSAIIFLKDSKENKEYVDKYAIDLESWQAKQDDLLQLKLKRAIPYSHIKRSRVLEILKLDQPALREAEAIIRIEPAAPFAYKVAGGVYLRKKSYLKAYEHFYKAYILGLRSRDIFQLLAEAYIGLERYKEAEEILRVGLKDYPKSKSMTKLLEAQININKK